MLKKAIKLEEQLQNLKVKDKIKDICINELASKVSAIESEVSNSLRVIYELK